MSAKFALGTYRITDQDPNHIQAIITAVTSGVRLIDTSTNYMDGGAERAIALAFNKLSDDAIKQVELVSKFGYIQGTTMQRVKASEPLEDLVEYDANCFHCIHPTFLQDQLTQSLERLNVNKIDCYLIHNPEYFMFDAINKKMDKAEMLDTMLERIYKAFVGLELEVGLGRIGSYGISSNSFAKKSGADDYLPFEDLVQLAQEAAKELGHEKHHFTTIQLPINILEQEGLKCARWAKKNGLRVLSNRPLNAQHNNLTYRLADYAEPADYYHHLNALLEMSDNESMRSIFNLLTQLDEVKHKFGWIGEYQNFLYEQILPHLRQSLSEFKQEGQESFHESIALFLAEYEKMVAFECSRATRIQLKDKLGGCTFALQQCALNFLQKQDDIDYILIGMRKVSYVGEVMGITL